MFTGIFSMFSRSRELRQFDRELRDAGLHPTLVPEPAKLTALKLLKEIGPVTEVASAHASLLLAYCILGRSDFEAVTMPRSSARSRPGLSSRLAPKMDWMRGSSYWRCIQD